MKQAQQKYIILIYNFFNYFSTISCALSNSPRFLLMMIFIAICYIFIIKSIISYEYIIPFAIACPYIYLYNDIFIYTLIILLSVLNAAYILLWKWLNEY